MQKINVTGSCHCQKVKYKAAIDPQRVRICHCNDCQIISGSAFRVNLPTDKNEFELLSGELKNYVKVAESGNKRALCFCDNCGTHIYSTAVKNSEELNLRVGTICERFELPPTSEQWQSEKQPWVDPL